MVARARPVLRSLAADLRSEDVRETIPTDVNLLGGRAPWSGERHEIREKLIKNPPPVTIAAYNVRGIVALRRSWSYIAVGLASGTLFGLGPGVVTTTVKAFLLSGRGRYLLAMSAIDPTTTGAGSVVVIAPRLAGARVEVDFSVVLTAPHAAIPWSGGQVAIWGYDSITT